MFDGLEVDQYVLSILQSKQTLDLDEVTIDQNAKMKPCIPTIKVRKHDQLTISNERACETARCLDFVLLCSKTK